MLSFAPLLIRHIMHVFLLAEPHKEELETCQAQSGEFESGDEQDETSSPTIVGRRSLLGLLQSYSTKPPVERFHSFQVT